MIILDLSTQHVPGTNFTRRWQKRMIPWYLVGNRQRFIALHLQEDAAGRSAYRLGHDGYGRQGFHRIQKRRSGLHGTVLDPLGVFIKDDQAQSLEWPMCDIDWAKA